MDKSSPSMEASGVRSVERAADLIEALMASSSPLSLADLSELVDLHRSTAHRLLATLEKRQFVYQDPESRHYSIGPKLMNPAVGLRSIQQLRNLALPVLQEITTELGENTSLAIRNGNQAMVVAQASSRRQINVTIQPEASVPLHATAVGKVILAHLDPEEVQRIIRETGLGALTQNTITDYDELMEALQVVRGEGYATDHEEWEIGIRCVAVPLFIGDDRVLGTISVSAPAGRVNINRQIQFARTILKYIPRLSAKLGYPPDDRSLA